MSANYTQENRFIKVATALGEDVLLLQRFAGQESISRLFHFDLYMQSENRNIDFEQIVGKNAAIAIVLPNEQERYIHGVVSNFTMSGSSMMQDGAKPVVFTHYHLALVPQLWLLTRTSDCRIFQNQTATDIITKILDEHGVKYANRLFGSFTTREYCVQYRETDFNFVSRLMEEEGIFYFFEHELNKHTLVLSNKLNSLKASEFHPKISYTSITGTEGEEEETITSFNVGREIRPGKYQLNDFNFKQPKLDLTANAQGKGDTKLEIFDYPGEYVEKSDGEKLVGVRMEEETAPLVSATASSTCRGLAPGYKFALEDHFRDDLNHEYVVMFLQHSADQGMNYRSSAGQASDFRYTNHFTCLPHDHPYRPARTTAVPIVRGTQTAIVTGPAGEEIYTDEFGRVKVQFHWDREGKYDEKSSCWVRVSQNWAGKGWGAMFLPRIGQEVIVDFLEGDPDRPLITGRVYNGESKPPYTLPDEKTKSTIKTMSSKGGGGFNELRFEDKKGKEQIFIHAERNEDIRVKADLFETVGGEAHQIIGKDKHEQVKGDKHEHVKGDKNQKVDGSLSLSVGGNQQEKVSGRHALDAGTEVHIKAGMKVVIEAGAQLTIKVGGNFIDINPAGVFIKGTMVMINSGGAAGTGSGSSPDQPKVPKEADTAEPGANAAMPPPKQPPKPAKYSPAALVLKSAAQHGTPFCEKCA